MKKWGYILALIIVGALLISNVACNISSSQNTSSRLATATRGNLSVSVSGSGNIEIANQTKLTLGVGGKITKINNLEGDRVKKGDILARLETDDLELALSQAENGQAQAELAVSQAELALRQAESAKMQAASAMAQAQVTLEAAKFDLDRMDDVKKIKDKIEEAENEQKIAEASMKVAIQAQSTDVDIRNWAEVISGAKQKRAYYQKQLDDLLRLDEYATLVVTEVKIKSLQVMATEQAWKQSIQAVEQAGLNIEQAKRNIDYTKKSLAYAAKSADYARKQLGKATLAAPFDGMIADIMVDEGDIVPSPTMSPKTIIHLIDTSSMELKVDVDENDIPTVNPGQRAVISVDALPDLRIEGKVTYISPIPSSQSGVILYRTTVQFQSLSGSQLRVGMSATANIVLQERKNVLLVPERAVYLNESGKSTVKVIIGGQAQERAVVTGITDGFDIEIISGLSEGETVSVETKAKSSSSGMSLMGQ